MEKEPGALFYDTKLDTSFSRITTSQEAEKRLQEHTPDTPMGVLTGEYFCSACNALFRIYSESGIRDGQDSTEAAIMVWREHKSSGECRRFVEDMSKGVR